jgi:hypothetical protein
MIRQSATTDMKNRMKERAEVTGGKPAASGVGMGDGGSSERRTPNAERRPPTSDLRPPTSEVADTERPGSQTVHSPGKRVRAVVAVETVWIGPTVYPECPVWRVWYDDTPIVDTSTVGVMTQNGPLAYGMRPVKATRHRPQTGIGPGREIKARFASRDGREIEVRVRVTDLSAFCAVREIPKRRSKKADVSESRDGCDACDLSITRFPEGAVLLGCEKTPNAERRTPSAEQSSPQVRFVPSGKLVAFWRHGLEQHAVFFARPGDLAVRRFGALERIEDLAVADGRQGCDHLFLTVPFTKAELPSPVFGAAVTPAYRAAFEMMLGRGAVSDDFWMPRGEPGEFAVAARRLGGVWQVAGVTAAAKTLTVRFEDLWLRVPVALRALRYTVELLRDPLKDEAGDRIEEAFAEQAPDVRVALDLAKGGGFLITFRPQA